MPGSRHYRLLGFDPRLPEVHTIKKAAGGLSRGELLQKLGLKGDMSGEISVSNALTALTKDNHVARRDGKYHAA
jgi:hypothetical protein